MKTSNIPIFEEEYSCKIEKEKTRKTVEYSHYTTIDVDYTLNFLHAVDAGEIAGLLAGNDINFFLHNQVIFLSYRALSELLDIAEVLWS